MSVLPVYNCFHPILKQATKPVDNINQDIKDFVTNMYETLYNISNGVGLAANQVGGTISIFIVDLQNGNKERKAEPITFINPEIISFSDDLIDYQEGCLSIPEYYENVKRPSKVEVKYYDIDMKEHIKEYDDFMARVIQHEIDHLDGILMFERISSLRRTMSKAKLNKIQRSEIYPAYSMIRPDGSLYLPEINKQ
ncbi:MAG TPA: peptide deformylase [Candidatus Kapabacteria bacterium]|nr:peptide deformylase [Candidatus Kapabacteria bacterium]